MFTITFTMILFSYITLLQATFIRVIPNLQNRPGLRLASNAHAQSSDEMGVVYEFFRALCALVLVCA